MNQPKRCNIVGCDNRSIPGLLTPYCKEHVHLYKPRTVKGQRRKAAGK